MRASGIFRSLTLCPFTIVAAVVLFLQASPAFATNNCLKDEFGKNVQCSANDVRVAKATNPRNLDGTPITSCNAGSHFSFIADFHLVTTATARENIGLYFQTGGGSSALTGTCSDNIISPLHDPGEASTVNCGTAGYGPCLGSAQYHEFDTALAGDNCGDTTSADGDQVITVEVDDVDCKAAPGTNQLSLPDCTSWQQPGGALLCVSDPNGGWPWVPAAIPGAPSKCHCDSGFTVPITVQSASISVTKTPSPTSLPDGGGSVDYTVVVTNTSNFGGVTINQICDDQYGNIATAAGYAGSACPNGTAGTASNVSCSLPATLASPGNNLSCTFTGAVTAYEGTFTDTVTVNAADQGGNPISKTAQATVTINEAPAQAQVLKSVDTGAECAIVRYKVEVDNISGSTTDESETLSKLNDSYYGDITKVNGNVLGTTCGVASGQGTLAGSAGAGTLSTTIAVGGKYTCEFDGKFCGALGNAGTSCTSGLENKDQITATLTGDDTGDEEFNSASAELTVDTCFSSSSQ